jgi:hypothetical protein
VRFIENWEVIQLPCLYKEFDDIPTSLPAPTLDSTNNPRMISKNPHAEFPFISGDDKLRGQCSAIESRKHVKIVVDILNDRQLTRFEMTGHPVGHVAIFETRVEKSETEVKHHLLSRTEFLRFQFCPEEIIVEDGH